MAHTPRAGIPAWGRCGIPIPSPIKHRPLANCRACQTVLSDLELTGRPPPTVAPSIQHLPIFRSHRRFR